MAITEHMWNVDRAILNTVFENTVPRVNKCLETGRGHFEHHLKLSALQSSAQRLSDHPVHTVVPTNSPYSTFFSALLSTTQITASTSNITTLPIRGSNKIPQQSGYFEKWTLSSSFRTKVLQSFKQLHNPGTEYENVTVISNFRLRPRCEWDRRSSGMLCRVDW
jgi:hypothetical protein